MMTYQGSGNQTNSVYPVFLGNILVCEDDLMNQELVSAQLSKMGLKAVIAGDGKDGVMLAESHMKNGTPFDLILMDIKMPVMDGFTAAKKLKEIGCTAPVVAYTSYDRLDMKFCINNGMSGYLEKPCALRKMAEVLSAYLTHADPHQMNS